MSENDAEKTGLQSGIEADIADDPKKKTKKRKKTSQAFQDNIITDSETAKARGSKGGKKSGEVRRENAQRQRDARDAARYLLQLAARGKLKDNLKELGLPDDECTNMMALHARMLTAAMQKADLDTYFALLKIAGYDPEEERKERESLAADRRREAELDAKIAALGRGAADASVSIALPDEDENEDVMIYMPQIATEESCQEAPEQTAENTDTSDGEE